MGTAAPSPCAGCGAGARRGADRAAGAGAGALYSAWKSSSMLVRASGQPPGGWGTSSGESGRLTAPGTRGGGGGTCQPGDTGTGGRGRALPRHGPSPAGPGPAAPGGSPGPGAGGSGRWGRGGSGGSSRRCSWAGGAARPGLASAGLRPWGPQGPGGHGAPLAGRGCGPPRSPRGWRGAPGHPWGATSPPTAPGARAASGRTSVGARGARGQSTIKHSRARAAPCSRPRSARSPRTPGPCQIHRCPAPGGPGGTTSGVLACQSDSGCSPPVVTASHSGVLHETSHDTSRPAQGHPCSRHVLLMGTLPGWLATRHSPGTRPRGARGSGSDPGSAAQPVPSGPTGAVRGPLVAGAEAQPVPAWARACCPRGAQAGSSDSRRFDTQGAAGKAAVGGPRGRGRLELLRGCGLCCRQRPAKRSRGHQPHRARPARLAPHGSSHTAHPARLIPHGSSHTAHPGRLAPRARRGPGVRWVGSGAGRESGKQETGSAEHRSRATRNRAQAKNSSRAAPGVGPPLLGREGALPLPAEPLGHGPHARSELPGELPGSRGAGPAVQEGESRRGRGSGEEPSKHRTEQKRHGAEGRGACPRGMGKGRGLSHPRAPRGPGCLQGAGAAYAPTGNTQRWGDQGPPGTTGWAPRAPRQPDLSFLGSSMAEGPRLRQGLAPLPAMSGASVPTPAGGDGMGSGGPRAAPSSLPSPVVSAAPALAAAALGNGGSGREMGGTGGPRLSPWPHTHHEAAACPSARGAGTAGEPGVRRWPGAAARGASVGCWAPLPRPQRAGGFMGPVSAGKVSGLWLRTRRPRQDTGQSPPRGGQAQLGWTHFGALLASVAT